MVISIDLSIHSTGFAIFDGEVLIDSGIITPERYPKQSIDRYPIKSVNQVKSTAKQIYSMIEAYLPQINVILIEEINGGGRRNIIGTKALCGIHYVLMSMMDAETLKKVRFIKSCEWRKALNLKRNGDWKQSAVDFINEKHGTDFIREDNDLTDALCLYYAYLKMK